MGFDRYSGDDDDFEDEDYYEDYPHDHSGGRVGAFNPFDWGWNDDELDPAWGAYDNEDDGQGPYYPGGYVDDEIPF